MQRALYPGTFDPVTNGHLDIITRSRDLFGQVIVGVAEDNFKHNIFSLEERLSLLQEATSGLAGVTVRSFSGLLVDFARSQEAGVIVRGLRVVSDFEYEMQQALMNSRLSPGIEIVFLMSNSEHSFLSSSLVRQVASLGGDVRGLVPPGVAASLASKYPKG